MFVITISQKNNKTWNDRTQNESIVFRVKFNHKTSKCTVHFNCKQKRRNLIFNNFTPLSCVAQNVKKYIFQNLNKYYRGTARRKKQGFQKYSTRALAAFIDVL